MLARYSLRVATSILLILFLAAPVAARKCGRGMPNYDPDAEMTLSGRVEKVSEQAGKKGCQGIHLWLVTDTKTVEVHVGPSHFQATKDFELAQGNELSIIGSPVPGDDAGAVIAREIEREGETLELRDENGLPKWRGGRRGKN